MLYFRFKREKRRKIYVKIHFSIKTETENGLENKNQISRTLQDSNIFRTYGILVPRPCSTSEHTPDVSHATARHRYHGAESLGQSASL